MSSAFTIPVVPAISNVANSKRLPMLEKGLKVIKKLLIRKDSKKKQLLVMIGEVVEDAEGAIELLHEDEADHLVGEGHLGE